MTFQVGDRVRLVSLVIGAFGEIGAEGTVRPTHDDTPASYRLCVEFDTHVPGSHYCLGRVTSGRGLWVQPSNLELIASNAHCGARSFGEFIRKQERLTQGVA